VRICQLDSSGSRYGSVAGFCEHDDEPSGFINAVKYLYPTILK
jgi:hypothetical protein